MSCGSPAFSSARGDGLGTPQLSDSGVLQPVTFVTDAILVVALSVTVRAQSAFPVKYFSNAAVFGSR